MVREACFLFYEYQHIRLLPSSLYKPLITINYNTMSEETKEAEVPIEGVDETPAESEE